VEGRAWPKENIARPDTFPTQSGRTRVPGVGRCAAGSLPPTSEGGAVCANERPYGSVRGVPGDWYPYRGWFGKIAAGRWITGTSRGWAVRTTSEN
jgi:hypothetical protein